MRASGAPALTPECHTQLSSEPAYPARFQPGIKIKHINPQEVTERWCLKENCLWEESYDLNEIYINMAQSVILQDFFTHFKF